MASQSIRLNGFARECYNDRSKYYNMWYYADVTWSESYDSQNNLTASNFSVTLRRSSTDYGYLSTCPSEDCKYVAGCTTPHQVAVATSLSSSPGWSTKGSYNPNCTHPSATIGTYSIPGSVTIAPNSSTQLCVAKGWSCSTVTGCLTITNTRSKPSPTPPSVTAYASCSAASYTTGSFSASVSYGYCTSQYNSTSYVITDANGNTIKSGSGTSVSVGTLQANSKYNVKFTVSNGCYTSTSSASMVTSTGNNLTDLLAKTWDSASVRIVPIMGGGVNTTPTHTIQITECNRNAWRNVATSNSTVPTVVEFSGLVQETCYQVRCVTTNGSGCSYTSSPIQFNTPKKGICLAEYTTIEPGMSSDFSNTYVDICYKYETLLTPADITVYYRVKDGFDDEWLVGDTRTVNTLTGSVCFQIENLFPNQVVYETYIHTHTAEVDWDSDIQEFITPLVPEVQSDNCESLTYMTEYLCAAIKKIKDGGNMKVFANPYSQQLCEPGNEAPTSLTLWSRYLRLAHAYLCILCDFMNLSNSHEGQYLVGEIGWVSILNEIVESQMEADGWKLATSGAIYNYINEKLKEVWHYQGTVDVIVENLADLDNYPDATSAIVKSEDAIYDKKNGTWTKNTELVPEDFGVFHVNYESDQAKAESAWYFWGGTWNNLDADLEDLEAQVEQIATKTDILVQNAPNQQKVVAVVDKAAELPASISGKDIIYFITEPQQIPEPTYYTVTFMDDTGMILRQEAVVATGIVGIFTPVKEGYNFTGWTLDGEPYTGVMPVTQDITVMANWQPKEVTVSFNIGAAMGQTPDPITTNYGYNVWLPGAWDFSLEGKTFGGWALNDVIWNEWDPVYEDMTLDAVWDSIYLTVAVDLGPNVPNQILSVEYGNTISPLPDPTRQNYTFTGWQTQSGEPFDFTTPITENTTIVAGWELAIATVTFNAQTLPEETDEQVEDPASQSVAVGEYATEPVVTAENYILLYWSLNGERFNFDTPITDSITLEAVWTEAIEVEFDTDGGTPVPETQKVPSGGYATEPENPTKEGCDFEGWEEVETHTVTFKNGDEKPVIVHVEAGQTVAEPDTPAPPREGCEFLGWKKGVNVVMPDLSQPITAEGLDALQTIIGAGEAQDYIGLGTQILVPYDTYTMPFVVVGYEDIELEDGTTAPALNLVSYYASDFNCGYSSGNYVAYSESILRTRINTTYQGKLDSAFLNCLGAGKVVTALQDGSTDVVYDKLFAPSIAKMGVTDTEYIDNTQKSIEGPAYPYYKDNDAQKRIFRKINNLNAMYAGEPWLRSYYPGNETYVDRIDSFGGGNAARASSTWPQVIVACNLIGKQGG